MIVINLFGGPGIGKSTIAAGVFSMLKLRGVNCELVTEYAKDLTWDEDWDTLSDQMKVTDEQYKRVKRLEGKVDVVITDSPILGGAMYCNNSYIIGYIHHVHNKFDNRNFLLNRVKPFSDVGRSQTEDEAVEIDQRLRWYCGSKASQLDGDYTAIGHIVDYVIDECLINNNNEVYSISKDKK